MLDYSVINKSQRSNSFIKNYNRRIKLKLSKFLFGKNKVKISWPLFIYFITNEEDDNKKEIFKLDNSVHLREATNISIINEGQNYSNIDGLDNNIVEEKEDKNNLNMIKSNNEHPFHRNLLNFVSYSCKHDTLFLLYTFVIYNKVKIEKQR